MAILTIRRGTQIIEANFQPPQRLSALLSSAGVAQPQPCGGRGVCGKCAVLLSGHISAPNSAEKRCNVRLSCQAIIQGDAEVILPMGQEMTQIAGGSALSLPAIAPMPGQYGAAVDLGTTTIALALYDLSTGKQISFSSMHNPQVSVAADVIGRIEAAMKGQADQLRHQGENAVMTLLTTACAKMNLTVDQVSSLVITGNTTMLYLLSGYDPSALSHAPFSADHLFGHEKKRNAQTIYFPHCMHAFVGADTGCALLASGMLEAQETALLCDVGTNGEMALWHQGKLYIASTAAGPAFEGAGISCGCSGIPGAICKAEVVDGKIIYHTIDDQKAVGICGSGLVDAIAAMLETGHLDETGLLETEAFFLQDGIALKQCDIRAVQLAKAAIYAGIEGLLAAAKCTLNDIEKMYIAGGFGSYLNLQSAVRIGLFPEKLAKCMHVLGNAALDGAAMLLLNTNLRNINAFMQSKAIHVSLAGNPVFADCYIEATLFGGE